MFKYLQLERSYNEWLKVVLGYMGELHSKHSQGGNSDAHQSRLLLEAAEWGKSYNFQSILVERSAVSKLIL